MDATGKNRGQDERKQVTPGRARFVLMMSDSRK